MANIDGLLKLALGHGADELRLTTDEPPQILKRGAPVRLFIPATPDDMLRHLLEGVLTSEREAVLARAGRFEGSYTSAEGQAFDILIEGRPGQKSASNLAATFRRASAPERAAAAPAAARDPAPPEPLQAVPARPGSLKAALLRPLLERAVRAGASDLHLCSGEPITLRIDGRLRTLDEPPLRDVEALFADLLDASARDGSSTRRSLDVALDLPGLGRFRANLYRAGNEPAAAIRILPLRAPRLSELHLPVPLDDLIEAPHGLILVSGPTGTGKSATLAALAVELLARRGGLLITLEDPVEYRIQGGSPAALVRQRQVGSDVPDFPTGLRDALREDPDVLLIGEMRDAETIGLALTAAETGHVVLASLHSRSAASAIERIVDAYLPAHQQQIRVQLADSLRAVISQRLIPRAQGSGRLPALEILRNNHTVANLIRESKTSQLATVLQSGRKEGMLPLERCLAELVRAGEISVDAAAVVANDPTALTAYLKG